MAGLPGNLPNSVLLEQIMWEHQNQEYLVNTLMANQQRVFCAFLQQQTALLPNSILEIALCNGNRLGFPSSAHVWNNLMSIASNTSNISNAQPFFLKDIQPINSPFVIRGQKPVIESTDIKRMIRTKIQYGRPRANTSPTVSNQIQKIRPKTNSFHSAQKQASELRHHPQNLPSRNADACALEEVAAIYLFNNMTSTEPSKPSEDESTTQDDVQIDVNQILDAVLESSQL